MAAKYPLHPTTQLVYTFLMHPTVVKSPQKQGLLPEKTQYTATKTLNSGVARVFYGARYLDPKTSRWISADPAMGEYTTGSERGQGGIYNTFNLNLYNYSNNNPIKYKDPDGEAPGDFFLMMDDAAIDFGLLFNDNSIRLDREYGSTIYQTVNSSGVSGYTYTIPNKGTAHSVTPSAAPEGSKAAAYVHTHSAYSLDSDNKFSGQDRGAKDGDIPYANHYRINGYVATPNGSLQKFTFSTGKITTIGKNMPSDSNDPKRLNKVSSDPSTTKYTIKKGDTLTHIAKMFDTTVSALVNENAIQDPNKIYAGKTLNVTN